MKRYDDKYWYFNQSTKCFSYLGYYVTWADIEPFYLQPVP